MLVSCAELCSGAVCKCVHHRNVSQYDFGKDPGQLRRSFSVDPQQCISDVSWMKLDIYFYSTAPERSGISWDSSLTLYSNKVYVWPQKTQVIRSLEPWRTSVLNSRLSRTPLAGSRDAPHGRRSTRHNSPPSANTRWIAHGVHTFRFVARTNLAFQFPTPQNALIY